MSLLFNYYRNVNLYFSWQFERYDMQHERYYVDVLHSAKRPALTR